MTENREYLRRRIMTAGHFTAREADLIIDYLDFEGQLTFNHHGSLTPRHQQVIDPAELSKVFACARVAA